MNQQPPITVDRTTADLATEMIALFGKDARRQIVMRANHSRDAGNVVRFCRWRLAGHLIDSLSEDVGDQTVH